MYEVRIQTDSITAHGERLTTFVCTFPRFILAEVNTHRMLSRSSASSRAIPVEKQIARLEADPFMPVSWGKNQKGMQAGAELSDGEAEDCRDEWRHHKAASIETAERLMSFGVHKQIANRLLEPHMWHTAIITATEWDNFWHLRDSELAQPEFRKVVSEMRRQFAASSPTLTPNDGWHLPFITAHELDEQHADYIANVETRVKVAVGRCARVSYLTHDGRRDIQADIDLAEKRLLQNGHMAPFEHVAKPMKAYERNLFRRYQLVPSASGSFGNTDWVSSKPTYFCGNFSGWIQARKLIPNEWDACAPQ